MELVNNEKLLSDNEITELIAKSREQVEDDRTLEEMIKDGEFPELVDLVLQKGKVSDSLFGENFKTKDGIPLRLMIRTSRISTHDENRGKIPFKDQVLALNHNYMLGLVESTVGTAQIKIKNLDPRTCVILSENTKAPVYENVLRAYMAKTSTSTSLYQAWLKAKNNSQFDFEYSGRIFNVGNLYPNCKLEEVVDTPSTKAGDDFTKSPDWFFENGLISIEEYKEIKRKSKKAFYAVANILRKRGILLIDTKTEHGENHDKENVLIDEAYTMDSSRMWLLDENGEILLVDGEPIQIGKENARKRVTKKGQQFTKAEQDEIAFDYIKGYQMLTGKRFVPDMRPRVERYREAISIIWKDLNL
jgi:phosphoribosylaminoimidazole-succinocarboxamide synthase